MRQQPSDAYFTHDETEFKKLDQRYLYTSVHCSIFIIATKVEATQVSMNGHMDKQNVVSTYNEILFSHKNSEILINITACMGGP